MKLLLNVLLILGILGVGYLIYGSIKEPIVFESAFSKRKSAVVKQLEKIRTAEEVYKSITGRYAPNFDTLKQVLKNENVATYKIIGNLDDETVESRIDTILTPAVDSLKSLGVMSIDSLHYVPFGKEGASFKMAADTLTYQSTLVNVVEVGIRYGDFMGKYDNPKYKRYNNMYNPDAIIKFGDLEAPNTSGNWR